MNYIPTATLEFLSSLNSNNNKEWFAENKSIYELAKQDFVCFIEKLIASIAQFDALVGDVEAKKAIFRIYRDTRFSNDKTPYKTNMGAHIVAYSKKPHDRAGYYLHIEPNNCFLAGGAYLPPAPWIKAIRQEIEYNADEYRSIVNAKDFKKYFGEVEGEKLKTAPKDYPKDHPEIELLKHKSFLAVHNLQD
ncbi:MAG: DUF2461 domain-containing protein, partial [Bacteroidetes bacterium]|nr:DUF2461 domain-containing protein [Bacteroidota bacterium]